MAAAITISTILVLAAVLYLALRLLVVRIIAAFAVRTRISWDETFVRHGVFNRLAAMAPGILVHILAAAWLLEHAEMTAAANALRLAANIWIAFFAMLTLHAFIDGLLEIYEKLPFARQIPIRTFTQVVKLAAVLVFIVISISMLLGKSPTLLVSGLGAMTAVLMLVFKDPILGFVAGIQLSANRMLAVGDWLEMPKYNADGDVIEVSLTTVKVRNWDQTITTIPTYALIADSFKNWRGINEAGGRRIMRSIFIDMTSVRFMAGQDIQRLRQAQLLCSYLDAKLAEVESYNKACGADDTCAINGRRLTNIGTFRAYLLAYLKNHPGINQNMMMMVRQLQPTAEGLPIQIYVFTADTAWVAHEGVQSDIFDHVVAVIPQFGLRLFQSPAGSDINAAVSAISNSTSNHADRQPG